MVAGIDPGTAVELYRKMRLCRRFEERVIELVDHDEIYGSTHEYIGQEAVAAGVSANLRADDYVSSTHRGHAHIICKGGDLGRMFAELMGRESGYNGGKGGSMHISDPSLCLLGANGIVGAGVPFAVGAALSARMRKTDQVAVAFFGDGAANQGIIHEAMNMAAIWNLAVLFACENNRYAVSTSIGYAAGIENLSERSKAYGFAGLTVDGMDVGEVYQASGEAIRKIRSGGGPFFMEFKTYRFEGHFTAEKMLGLHYRSAEEIQRFRERCPVSCWRKRLAESGIAGQERLDRVDAEVESSLDEAVSFARASALPAPDQALEHMYAVPYPGIPQGRMAGQ